MIDAPDIGEDRSCTLAGHAVVSGFPAALIRSLLIEPDWRARLVKRGVAGPELEQVEEALAALALAGTRWRHEQISGRGNQSPLAEAQGKPDDLGSNPMVPTEEAAAILARTPRRVRQLVEEGLLDGVKEGKQLLVPLRQVLSLQKRRAAG